MLTSGPSHGEDSSVGYLDDAEDLAAHTSQASGADDRPHADPGVIAVGYCELRLTPGDGRGARLVGDRIVYPRAASPQAAAFWQGHELFHFLIRHERAR